MTSVSHPALLSLAAVPIVIGGSAAMLGGRASRRLSPAAATVLLTALALTVALVTGLLLCLAGVVALAQLPPLSGFGHWTPHRRFDTTNTPIPLGRWALFCGGCSGGRLAEQRKHSSTQCHIADAQDERGHCGATCSR